MALRTAEERQETEKQDKEVCQAKLRELDVAMQQLQAQLDAQAPEHAQRQQALTAKTEELEACQRRMDTLYAKQIRGKRFHTVEERNEYLNGMIERLNSDIQTKQSQLQAIQAEVAAEQASVAEADATIARRTRRPRSSSLTPAYYQSIPLTPVALRICTWPLPSALMT